MAKVPKADGARPRAKVVKRARASHRAFLHLRLCMLAARTIENEYLRNAFDMRNGADKIHISRHWHKGGAGSCFIEIHSRSCADLYDMPRIA